MAKKSQKEEASKKDAKSKEKEEKRKARMEALKQRPAEQRPNSKQIDIIELANGGKVKNYGYAVKNKEGYQGVLVTSVVEDKDGNPISTSVTFVPGNLTVKSKKNHGVICNPKPKKKGSEEDAEDEEESGED